MRQYKWCGSAGLRPESWRRDLLEIVLRVASILGTAVGLPSLAMAWHDGKHAIFVLDIASLGLVVALAAAKKISADVRAGTFAAILYALGAGLTVEIGSIGQTFLLAFSIMTLLLLGPRWGRVTIGVNAATMLLFGLFGLAAPSPFAPVWTTSLAGWLVVTVNFLFVNTSIFLAVAAVLTVLERALARSNAALRERVRAERRLRDSEALFHIAGQMARIAGWRVDVRKRTFEWTEEIGNVFEAPLGTATTVAEIVRACEPETRRRIEASMERCMRDGTPIDLEGQIVTASGARLWLRAIGRASRNERGEIAHVSGYIQDISAQKFAEARHEALEEHLRQSQKMETIGSLAGGIAHDMNNLMSVVVSYSEILAEELGEPARTDLLEIHAAGRRAVGLTRQLLAFSRQQVLAPKILDITETVAGMEGMLRRLIGEDIELVTACHSVGGKVLVDPGQLEQVIMNLVVNARDAMPTGGRILIASVETFVTPAEAASLDGIKPGPHVLLTVSDTGTGMDRATQARMFEPFFTTKEQGKGTGLGLATVFGVVRQSDGAITVSSTVGRGTTIKVYLPIAEGGIEADLEQVSAVRPTPRGHETILLVEDEEGVRVLARTILQKYGYEVLEAQSGGDALLLCEQYPGEIDLLLTDVVMPRTSGRKLAERLLLLRPSMKVLFMSGYTNDAVMRHGIFDSTIAFYQKPVLPEPFARKVREVLDGTASKSLAPAPLVAVKS